MKLISQKDQMMAHEGHLFNRYEEVRKDSDGHTYIHIGYNDLSPEGVDVERIRREIDALRKRLGHDK